MISIENLTKKGKHPDGIQIFTFYAKKKKRFLKKSRRW